jgi:hypothetical protein
MANTKISALTSASTPVAGTEVLPIVQSGTTVKLAISDITPGLTTISATKGGTGQTSYAVGDLLYASTTTALSKLADVATGNALISGGVSTAPSWGKIGLTTHVSGILPLANGGTNNTTGASTAVTSNSTSGVLQITGPAAASTRVMTVPDANFTAARTDAGQTFTGNQVITGNTLVGVASNILSARFVAAKNDANTLAFFSQDYSAGNADCVAFVNGFATGANAAVQCRFYNNTLSTVGTITSSGSGTLYNVTSDYRLKNITGTLTGYKERLMSLQPKQGTWKYDNSEFRGFLAHEFASAYRASVTGQKDDVDANGNPIMQSMQAGTAEVMADLIALMQEQQTQIEALKVEIASLKN